MQLISRGQSEPSPDRQSPWMSPPVKPARYKLGHRLTDMLCGFLDGKHGIPELAEPRADERARDFAPPPTVRTPRIDMLIRQANQRIEGEWSNLVDDRVRLKQRRTEHQITFDALSKELLITEGRMTEARHPLSDHERDARRLAESDQQQSPGWLGSRPSPGSLGPASGPGRGDSPVGYEGMDPRSSPGSAQLGLDRRARGGGSGGRAAAPRVRAPADRHLFATAGQNSSEGPEAEQPAWRVPGGPRLA